MNIANEINQEEIIKNMIVHEKNVKIKIVAD